MLIPERLDSLLRQDPNWHGQVLQAITNFEPWLKQNKLEFFPEYTDHGIEHLEGVLRSATWLISDDAWEELRPSDAAALVLSVLLHDLGMHLTPDGFLTLLDESRWHSPLPDTKDKPWPLLWEEFMLEARRFDGRKLTQLFGDTTPARRPPADSRDWTHLDKVLIGEFVRRHHPRLAHEIAVYGTPGRNGSGLNLGLSDPKASDLIGLIARSHGISLRDSVDRLQQKHLEAYRDYKGVFAPFTMALLRIADYLQIGPERAPQQYMELQGLRSPISVREWKINQEIDNITNTAGDPDAIYVTASPQDVYSFSRLQFLFTDLQSELDNSWAVLGELFGRDQTLCKLGMKIRRIRSNLDNVEAFGKTTNYVPQPARFTTADAELLSLLIRPLYGNKPEVGIRELMQNSVDAVLELRTYLSNHNLPEPELTEQEGDVVISVQQNAAGGWEVVVSDRGIGMTPNTICNFFLRAGASFRKSSFWQSEFIDEENHSKVLRSGRFGVGALAAFLLGDEIHVSTRHVTATDGRGIEFSASMEANEFELKYVNRPVGTTVTVPISEQLAFLFESRQLWDWYCLDDPVVIRRHDSIPTPAPQLYHHPQPLAVLPSKWRRLEVPSYLDVHWNMCADRLACNGIVARGSIPAIRLFKHNDIPNFPLSEHRFALSVFDRDGLFPLRLTRDRVENDEPPFSEEIEKEFLIELIAHLLINGPTKVPQGDGSTWVDSLTNFGQLKSLLSNSSWWHGLIGCLGTQDGFGLAEAWTLKELLIERLLLIPYHNRCDQNVSALACEESRHAFAVLNYPVAASSIESTFSWEKTVLNLQTPRTSKWQQALSYNTVGRRLIVPKIQDLEWYFSRRRIPNSETFESIGKREEFHHGWQIVAAGNCPSDTMYEERMIEACANSNVPKTAWLFGQWFLDPHKSGLPPSRLQKLWIEIIGQPLIPYDMDQRREQLKHAFERLKPYIELIEAERES